MGQKIRPIGPKSRLVDSLIFDPLRGFSVKIAFTNLVQFRDSTNVGNFREIKPCKCEEGSSSDGFDCFQQCSQLESQLIRHTPLASW